ncbi:helix-turn-helix domain-containing protein [Aequorivita sp. SDUM287046]|uniref:Helix-turn-helix domain-containing protein n=1 Tax=Aequorivita aurantiaca TaxID=3053356 RepID=A0ABT8DGY8_9FLAO|nr:helix-turn-helix domain-containing protein [Aequorivita aurantiaca]MDN3724665.1 helix-turn-helix domain-containing protein [Aequorivita aurantiaca]
MSDVGNVILWAALIQGLLLALLYIFSKTHSSFANTLLGFFLLSIILEALTTILPFRYIGSYPVDTYFSLLEVKLFIPLFFIHYVLEKIGKSAKYRKFLKYNYILATAIGALTILNIFLFFMHSVTLEAAFGPMAVENFHLAQQLYAFAILVAAFTIAITETRAFRKLAQNEYSDYKMLQINWLWQFIFMLVPATLLWGIEIARILFIGPSETNLEMIIWGFVALFFYFLSYKAYQHANLFDQIPHRIVPENEVLSNEFPFQKCDAFQSEAIHKFMVETELFLNQDLTLHHFAKAINMSPRLISTCINTNFGNNFNEWVNGFRVEKAIKLIETDTKNQLSLEGIGTAAGFKSRSTMYSAFQKKLGHSPGQYRKL